MTRRPITGKISNDRVIILHISALFLLRHCSLPSTITFCFHAVQRMSVLNLSHAHSESVGCGWVHGRLHHTTTA